MPGSILLAVLLFVLLWPWQPPAGTEVAGQDAAISPLVHWRDARHDWLLVVDPATRELVVYDANDGRPLERLGTDEGLPPVRSIARQGQLLLVTGERHPRGRLLKLPELQLVAR